MNSRKIYLNKSDKNKISQIIKKGSAGRSVTRALVLKMKDYGYTNIEAAEIAEITPRTVVNICIHYLNGGLESALNDDPRVGRPTEIDDGMKAQIIATLLVQNKRKQKSPTPWVGPRCLKEFLI